MSTGRYLVAAAVLVGAAFLLEQFDPRIALWFVALTLLALFFRYPDAAGRIAELIGWRNPLPPNERT